MHGRRSWLQRFDAFVMAPSGPTLLGSQGRVAQAGKVPWTKELEEVSRQLEKQLKDPLFVAQRCDLDSSGDLDRQELKQAASCFGVKLSSESFQMDQPRISKERFAEIVRVPGPGRRCVPHSFAWAWPWGNWNSWSGSSLRPAGFPSSATPTTLSMLKTSKPTRKASSNKRPTCMPWTPGSSPQCPSQVDVPLGIKM